MIYIMSNYENTRKRNFKTFKLITFNNYTVLYRLTLWLDIIKIVTKIMFHKISYPDFKWCQRDVRLCTLIWFTTIMQKLRIDKEWHFAYTIFRQRLTFCVRKNLLFGPVYSTAMAIMPIKKICGGLPGCTQQTEQGQRKIQNPDG